MCVCGQYLAQDKDAKTVVVVTIPFLFNINFYWSIVCFILSPFPRLPFHRWGNWGSGNTMCFRVPETWVVCLNTSGSKVPVFVPFWDPPNHYPAFRKPAYSNFPGWHILFSRVPNPSLIQRSPRVWTWEISRIQVRRDTQSTGRDFTKLASDTKSPWKPALGRCCRLTRDSPSPLHSSLFGKR